MPYILWMQDFQSLPVHTLTMLKHQLKATVQTAFGVPDLNQLVPGPTPLLLYPYLCVPILDFPFPDSLSHTIWPD